MNIKAYFEKFNPLERDHKTIINTLKNQDFYKLNILKESTFSSISSIQTDLDSYYQRWYKQDYIDAQCHETIESSLQIFNLYTIKINLKKLVKINSTTGICIRLRKICRCLHELIKCSLLMIPPNDSWRNKTYKINDVNTEQQFGYFQNDDIYKNNEIVLNNSGTGNNKKITGSLRLLP